ncbi:carboxylesterase [Croceicoccus estronivorus]|nr:carboxylesterase [Croceicoccus estronivorus]
MGDGAAFRGIPYAAPPVGALRWKDAQPATPWQGVRDATDFGPACIQPIVDAHSPQNQNEDCLTLNIVTPDRKAKGLPVLFSIHGGAFFVGSNRYVAHKDITSLLQRGVILVAPNYRLGRMGFFAHPALTAEAGRGTGNFWLTDQIAALQWVKRNIAAFGGDPDRITIQGCSAGGSSVNSLMVSPRARGLFARAAVHSGGGLFNATRPLARAEREGVAFAGRVGVEGEGAAALAALRALTAGQVLAGDSGAPNFGAIIDEYYLPSGIGLAYATGAQAPVPLIAGSTSNEASVFGLMGFDASVLKSRFDIDLETLRPAYERDGELSDQEFLRRVQTDFIFTSAALGIPSLASRLAPAWAYHFDYLPAASRGEMPGAPHCADMSYLYSLTEPADANDRMVGEIMRGYWYNFIATGNPNGPALPIWPQAKPGVWSPLVIGDPLRIAPDYQIERMRLWHAKWLRESGAPILP